MSFESYRTYAYCLLPNHFHFLQRVTDETSIVSEQFRKFFIKYSQAINVQQKRTGSLLQKPFKRKEITSNDYLTRVIFYIHSNPQKHGLVDGFKDYPHSSFARILNPTPSKLIKEDVLNWFGSSNKYLEFHQSISELELGHAFDEL